MSQRISRGLILFCLPVILVSGTPRIYSSEGRTPRHASCPSCSRDCPDALASGYVLPSRDFVEEPESPQWTGNQPYMSSPAIYGQSLYDGAPGSRGVPDAARGTCKRENPFAIHKSFDFNVAPPPSNPFHGVEAPVSPYQPRLPVSRNLGKTSYQRPSFYDVMKRQCAPIPTNDRHDYHPVNVEPSFGGVGTLPKRYHRSESPDQKVYVVYRADKYSDDFLEREKPDIPVGQYSRRQIPQEKSLDTRMEQFYQPRRMQHRESPISHVQDVKYNPYSFSPELDVQKIIKKIEREEIRPANDSVWEKQLEQEGNLFKDDDIDSGGVVADSQVLEHEPNEQSDLWKSKKSVVDDTTEKSFEKTTEAMSKD